MRISYNGMERIIEVQEGRYNGGKLLLECCHGHGRREAFLLFSLQPWGRLKVLCFSFKNRLRSYLSREALGSLAIGWWQRRRYR